MSTTQTDTSAVRYDRDADGIVTLTLDDPTASANTMNELYVDSMAAAVDRLYDEAESVTGVVVASAKKTFFAGANLNEMVKAGPADAPRVFELAERVKASLRRLETFPKPVAAAINGAALGGGFEIALACNHRVVVDGRLRGRAPRGQPRPAPRRWRRHPHHPAARHPERADGRAAPGQHLQAGGGQGEGARRRARRHPGRAGPGRQGLDQGQPGRRTEPVGRPRLQDARRLAEDAGHGRLPAGVPRAAAQAAQGRGLPGAEGDPVGRRRGRPGRLRHREPDRVALPHQPGRQPGLEEHDPGVLLRPAGDQRRQAPPAGHRAVAGDQGRRPRRRDDGRRHRLRLRPRRHGGRAQGRRRRERREGQGLLGEAARQGDLPRPLHRGEEGRAARPDQGHRRPGRPRRLRPGHRGGLRGPVAQGEGVRRDPRRT